jgi:hypothetical protein
MNPLVRIPLIGALLAAAGVSATAGDGPVQSLVLGNIGRKRVGAGLKRHRISPRTVQRQAAKRRSARLHP